jgi:ribosome-associated heat shock protein Hsp15
VEDVRVDRWLWAVRLFTTRTAATDACRAGHVTVNGKPVKAATAVRRGDRVEARVHGRTRLLEVVEVLERRVGPAVAATCYVDDSPPPPETTGDPMPLRRERGSGRPTKRDRRQIDRLRGN